MMAIVRSQVAEREEAALEYEAVGRADAAERLRVQARVLLGYLTGTNDEPH